MNRQEFINQIHRRIAQTAIGPSTIRNQGASGLIKVSRDFFEKRINLVEFRKILPTKTYPEYLDKLTEKLKNKFPQGGQSWGAARKGLNLFFRDVIYNKYLADYLKIPSNYNENLLLIKNLEIPLDKYVANKLHKIYSDLPKWHSIKELDFKKNRFYQKKALLMAEEKGIARIHLDLEFWRSDI